MESLVLSPIGVVHREASDNDVKREPHDLESLIEVYPQYQEGLAGIEGYSHLFVLGHFHKLRPDQIGPLKVRPRRLMREGLREEDLPLVGVFALGSPTRPNPIGLSLVRLVQIRDSRLLLVRDLDFFDGTPILDIKPYQGLYHSDEYQVPRWVSELATRAGLPRTDSV
jgi:tRNA (adenine37-N6)-methyltransferase